MTEDEIQRRVEQELTEKRFKHTLGVVESATALALRFGVNPEKARVAALVHDIAREWSRERLACWAEKVEIPPGFATIPELLHGPIAAVLLQEWFDIQDDDTANAVRYHTTGRVGMSELEMVILLADAIEPGRNYPNVEQIREYAKHDLILAVASSLDCTIRYLLDRHQPIFPLTIMARNELWQRYTAARSST